MYLAENGDLCYERAIERSRKRASIIDEGGPEVKDESSDYSNSVGTQTDLSMKGIDEDIAKRSDEIIHLKFQLEVIKDESKDYIMLPRKQVEEYTLNEASFENNDIIKVLYRLITWDRSYLYI